MNSNCIFILNSTADVAEAATPLIADASVPAPIDGPVPAAVIPAEIPQFDPAVG